ncbi:MAG: imidazoleglycerol-phosphate dehydratase HisB [Oscillospiraceae bacterium]|nr:imidazoleglycerol-phosphate dehydratase HisB [Oscillospiraceae bacterium]MDD4413568.1 imidazoleglycerol-phosphate dehydratase HisB [Oscillospiraceae bacterium]
MRTGECSRKTKETNVYAKICLDGRETEISTGIGFFDHMLEAFAVHGGFGMTVKVKGDLNVDGHHTVEDTGIALGKAMAEALGDKGEIARFGSFTIPMDEVLASAAVDISGRPFLVFDAVFPEKRVGDYDTCLTSEFFRAFAFNAGITLHMSIKYGGNAHHMTEALYKAAAHAIRLAVIPRDGVLSTKGTL